MYVMSREEIGDEFHTYRDSDGRNWNVSVIFELMEDQPSFDVDIDSLRDDLSQEVWEVSPMEILETHRGKVIGHVARAHETDLSFPILLDPDGEILDGCHRILKAILEGRKTIRAKKVPSWEFIYDSLMLELENRMGYSLFPVDKDGSVSEVPISLDEDISEGQVVATWGVSRWLVGRLEMFGTKRLKFVCDSPPLWGPVWGDRCRNVWLMEWSAVG